jgi:hypothetical protein
VISLLDVGLRMQQMGIEVKESSQKILTAKYFLLYLEYIIVLFAGGCFVELVLCFSVSMVTYPLFSGVDMVPVDPAARGGPHVSRNFQTYRILKFVVISWCLNCVLLKEGNTVRDLGVTSMTSIAGTPTH